MTVRTITYLYLIPPIIVNGIQRFVVDKTTDLCESEFSTLETKQRNSFDVKTTCVLSIKDKYIDLHKQ